MLCCSLKRVPPHRSAQEKRRSYKKHKACGRSSPPHSSHSKRSGLERALRCLLRCSIAVELFQQDRQIIVGVQTGDLPIADLQDKTAPRFAQAPRSFKRSGGQSPCTRGGPAMHPLKDYLILGGKHSSQLCPLS